MPSARRHPPQKKKTLLLHDAVRMFNTTNNRREELIKYFKFIYLRLNQRSNAICRFLFGPLGTGSLIDFTNRFKKQKQPPSSRRTWKGCNVSNNTAQSICYYQKKKAIIFTNLRKDVIIFRKTPRGQR